MMTTKRKILRHLESGRSINPMAALVEYGTMRLARHIHELREDGYPIMTRMKSSLNQKRYAEYYLAPNEEKVIAR